MEVLAARGAFKALLDKSPEKLVAIVAESGPFVRVDDQVVLGDIDLVLCCFD